MRTGYENLSAAQKRVVDCIGEGMAVLAGAGAGKTTTLVIKCEELLKKMPGARIAAVSFTEKSASDIRAKLAQRDLDLSPHWVTTIHGLCGLILREFPKEAGFDGEESMLSEPEAQLLWQEAIDSLWFAELPDDVDQSIRRLLAREGRQGLVDLLKRVRELESFGAIASLETRQDPDSRALAQVAREAISRYERKKLRLGALDFSDLERGADRALEHERVRRAFHERFELVLGDEFQDTNPLQARILERFCRPGFTNLCVVGDPKQSIYRFRDADVSVFEEFCGKLPQLEVLSENYRSRPGILDFTNEVCAPAFEASQMRYDPLTPKREVDAGAAWAPVEKLPVSAPEELGPWILAQQAAGVTLGEMALLVRRIRGNEKWFKALAASGIPVALGSGGLFWEDPRVREMVALLKWWDHPSHTLSAVTFLRAPWVAVPDLQIDEWVKRDPTLLKPFLESGHPIARALAPLRGRILRPSEVLLALAVSDAVEAEIGTALIGLWHRVEALSSNGRAFHAVVLELADAVENGRRERDVPPPRGGGSLSVLTLHSAKGLEFPHVILIDFSAKSRAMPLPLLLWDREEGAFLVSRDESLKRDDKSEEYQRWKTRERDKALAESKRVFYVALTRAKERLILVCPELPEKVLEKGFSRETAYLEEDWRAWIECVPSRVPELAGVPRASVSRASARSVEKPTGRMEDRVSRITPEVHSRVRPRHSVTEWNLLSRCERAYAWRYVQPDAPWISRTEKNPSIEATSPRKWIEAAGFSQRELGTAVHGALEHQSEETLEELERELGAGGRVFRARPVIEWLRASPWFSPEMRSWSELSFEVRLGSEVLVGSMDRLTEKGGDFTLLDFKVTSATKMDSELLEDYRVQMSLYAYAAAALEPAARGRLDGVLVAITPLGVREVRVPLDKDFSQVERNAFELAERAARIVRDPASARAQPGKACKHCDFRDACREGQAHAI